MSDVRFKGFVGQSYLLHNEQYDCQRTINWYPEIDETQLGKDGEIAQLTPTPGLTAIVTGLQVGSRGGYVTSTGALYWVFSSSLYLITASETYPREWGARLIGSIANETLDPVFFTDNGINLFILVNGRIFTAPLGSTTITELTGDGGFGHASTMTYIDGYVVFTEEGTNKFFWTDPYDTVINALNFASAETNPDQIVGIINNNLDLWVFGKRTTELWFNYGANNVTFQRRTSGMIETGCISPYTIKKLNNTIFWLGTDDRGGPILLMANGQTPTRVSTYAVEQQWIANSKIEELEKARAYTYQEGGHYFYVLNIEGQDTTWVYDMTTSLQLGQPVWHERKSTDETSGLQKRHLAEGCVYYRGALVTGLYNGSSLCVFDKDAFYDIDQPIVRERVTPHVSNSMDRVYYDKMVLDFYTGTSRVDDLDPQIMVQFSDDGGLTWSNERYESVGMIGNYKLRVQVQRLGSARSRVFRVRCSDPIYWAISGASLTLRMGTQ